MYDFWLVKVQDSHDVLRTGRSFMRSVSSLIVVLGFQGLAVSHIEGWNFLDAVYFSVVSMLTVGKFACSDQEAMLIMLGRFWRPLPDNDRWQDHPVPIPDLDDFSLGASNLSDSWLLWRIPQPAKTSVASKLL
jgi:hypothetical protein